MMRKKKTPGAARLLTGVELELMTIVWQRGDVTVKDVLEGLPKGRRLAYTSVATVLKILETKGVLACKKDAHAHTYAPLVAKEEYERAAVEHVVTSVFEGEPVALVQRLLSDGNLSADDLARIEVAIKALAERGRETL